MPGLNAFTLLISGLTLPLSLSFLLIILWSDRRKELNQFFGIFMLLVCLWTAGSFIAQTLAVVEPVDPVLLALALGFVEIGFTGASVALYALTAALVRFRVKRFRVLVFATLVFVFAYRVFLILTQTDYAVRLPQAFSGLFFAVCGGGTLIFIWRFHRKIRSRTLRFGVLLFVVGQGMSFLNPQLRLTELSLGIAAFASLVISFTILEQEILRPLAERNSQVEAIKRLNLAITRQTALDSLLNQIARQAAALLDADGVGIFLHQATGAFRIANVYNLPSVYLDAQMSVGQGIAGRAIQSRQSLVLDDYGRDWRGSDDLPFARQTFGSVVCSPLIHGDEPIGALMIVAGRQGRLFGRDDVYLLELLGAQAAVAITHSRLFVEQQELTSQVEYARSQLETVLTSTESPVIALDRAFRLIFANPAARSLINLRDDLPLLAQLPRSALPGRQQLREIKRNRSCTYEIAVGSTFYLCHLAPLGYPRVSGWVAVLNDVTQLKELDRLKSEMVRMTSHDLKNPLQAAMANVELLQDELLDLGIDNADVSAAIHQIDKQLTRMNRIIRGILDLERVKFVAQSFEYCAPQQIVERTLDEMSALAADRRIMVTAEVPPDTPAFACDPDQFERALINLVENAIKFTPSGGRVDVRVHEENGNLVFQVEDSGVGIAPELQPRVFDRFYRANQKGTEYVTGVGLGLSLVKTIVENHRGKVTLTSQLGVGTTFVMTVPIHAVKN